MEEVAEYLEASKVRFAGADENGAADSPQLSLQIG